MQILIMSESPKNEVSQATNCNTSVLLEEKRRLEKVGEDIRRSEKLGDDKRFYGCKTESEF